MWPDFGIFEACEISSSGCAAFDNALFAVLAFGRRMPLVFSAQDCSMTAMPRAFELIWRHFIYKRSRGKKEF
jgi:hypothetical protein